MNVVEMIEEVRNSTHELNTDFLDAEDIVIFLNRGQRNAQNILSRTYEEFFHEEYITDLVVGEENYTLPNDCLAARVQKVDILTGDYSYEVRRISLSQISRYEAQGSTSYPEFFLVIGNKVKLLPTPSSHVPNGLRIYYSKRYPEMGIAQGRVDKSTETSIIIDSFTTNKDGNVLINAGDFINICDPYYGDLRGTFLVQSISGSESKINIRSTFGVNSINSVSQPSGYFGFSGLPDFSQVRKGDELVVSGSTGNNGLYTISMVDIDEFRLYVSESIPSPIVDGNAVISISNFRQYPVSTGVNNISRDDIITVAPSKGVSDLPEAFHDYIVQYAVVETLKKAKEFSPEELDKLLRLEKEVRVTWQDRLAFEQIKIYNDYDINYY